MEYGSFWKELGLGRRTRWGRFVNKGRGGRFASFSFGRPKGTGVLRNKDDQSDHFSEPFWQRPC